MIVLITPPFIESVLRILLLVLGVWL